MILPDGSAPTTTGSWHGRALGIAVDDIEAIKQLKARYVRMLDTKDWDGMRRDGVWRIKTLRLTRLRQDMFEPSAR